MLVVSGPGGAGKSTLIEQLASGRLTAELRRLLPIGAEAWPEIMPTVLRRRPGAWNPADEYVLHYDIAGPVRHWGIDYSADPALARLPLAGQVTIVDIRLPRDQLIRQSASRTAAADHGRNRISRLWNQPALKWMFRPAKALHRHRRPAKLDLYARTGWLEGIYDRWDAYLEALSSRTALSVIRLEPQSDSNGYPSFRIVTCTE